MVRYRKRYTVEQIHLLMANPKEVVASATEPIAETVPAIQTESTEVVSGITFESFEGKDNAEIVALLGKSKDYKDNPSMLITNITLSDKVVNNISHKQMTLSVNRALPAYLKNERGEAERKTSKNVFVAAFQLSSVLKNIGESAFAKKILSHPATAVSILEGARVSVFTREYSAGETEVNPFASADNGYVFEADTVKHYVYDIQLGAAARDIKARLHDRIAAEMYAQE
jgi:hypothetical protein